MGYYITDPSKNRVWKNFSSSRFQAGKFVSQTIDNASETTASPTKTASGVLYYGYRYYSPGMGRWINRDPIGERGGLNVYGFVNNNSIIYSDNKGLTFIDLGRIGSQQLQGKHFCEIVVQYQTCEQVSFCKCETVGDGSLTVTSSYYGIDSGVFQHLTHIVVIPQETVLFVEEHERKHARFCEEAYDMYGRLIESALRRRRTHEKASPGCCQDLLCVIKADVGASLHLLAGYYKQKGATLDASEKLKWESYLDDSEVKIVLPYRL